MVSYTSLDDFNFVRALVCKLRGLNYTVWRDEDILYHHPTENHLPEIQSGIDNSNMVLYIHSEKSEQNDFVQEKELPYAHSKGKKILVHLHNYRDTSFPRNPWLADCPRTPSKGAVYENTDEELFILSIAVEMELRQLSVNGVYIKLETCPDILSEEQLQVSHIDEAFIWPIPSGKAELLKRNNFFSGKSGDITYHNQLHRFLSENCKDIEDIPAYLEEIAEETADEFIQKLNAKRLIFNGPMLGVSNIEASRSADGKEIQSLRLDMYRSDYFTFKCMSKLYQRLTNRYPDRALFYIQYSSDIPRYAPFLCSLGMGGFLVTQDEKEIKTLWIRRSSACEAGNLYHFSYDETVSEKDLTYEREVENSRMKINLYNTMYRGIKEELGLSSYHITKQGGIFEIGIILTSTRIELELLSYAVLDNSIRSSFMEKVESAADSKLEIGSAFFLGFDGYQRHLTDGYVTPEALALIRRLKVRKDENRLLTHYRLSDDTYIGEDSQIGLNTLIENLAFIGKRCRIGNDCKIHRNVFIDDDVVIGNNVKIQNNVMVPHGVTLKDGVFVGPSVVFTNDKYPRSITPDGKLKTGDDWKMTPTVVEEGASLGGGAVLVCGVTVGKWAMVGAGAVVTKDVPDYALVMGFPARIMGKVNEKGEIIERL